MKYFIVVVLAVSIFAGVTTYFVLSENSNQPQRIQYQDEIFVYICDNRARFSIQYNEDSERAKLSFSGLQYVLSREPSDSGIRYTDEDSLASFWEEEGQATLMLPDGSQELRCQSQALVPSVPEPQLVLFTATSSGELAYQYSLEHLDTIVVSGSATGLVEITYRLQENGYTAQLQVLEDVIPEDYAWERDEADLYGTTTFLGYSAYTYGLLADDDGATTTHYVFVVDEELSVGADVTYTVTGTDTTESEEALLEILDTFTITALETSSSTDVATSTTSVE